MLLHDAKLSVSMALPQNSNFYLICPELQEQTSIPEQQPAAWILRSGLFYCEAVWILCQPHGFAAEESRCWTSLPTAQSFRQHLEHHETQNVTTMSRDCRAARILHHTGTGQHVLIKSPAAALLSYRCLWADVKRPHSGKHLLSKIYHKIISI